MPSKYKKRPDGRYLIQVVVGYKPDGKPKYKNIYAKTIRELEEKAAKVRDEIDKGITVDDSRLTVREWGERWMALYKTNVGYNTRRMYETVLNCHIYPSIGAYRLRDVKPHHVQEMLNKLVSVGKARTVEQVRLTLGQMFDRAVKSEYLYKNVMDSISVPKREKAKKRALTEEEIRYVRAAGLPLKEKTFVILLLTTGLRRGEAFALTQNDIDMKERLIAVNKNAIVIKKKMEIKNSPKTDAGNRKIPITDELYGYLSEYLPTVKSIYVFPTARNTLMTDTAYRHMWDKIIDGVNLAAGGKIIKRPIEKESADAPGRRKVETTKLSVLPNDITPHIFRHSYVKPTPKKFLRNFGILSAC